jgi:hypothetical protein
LVFYYSLCISRRIRESRDTMSHIRLYIVFSLIGHFHMQLDRRVDVAMKGECA